MNAKKVLINHEKLGKIELGKLSHNELCRGVVSLMEEVQKSHQIINELYLQEANRRASIDADTCSTEDKL
jgi:hypothetical protein